MFIEQHDECEETQPIVSLPVLKEWLSGGRVLCYRFFDTERSTIDAWAADLADEMARWPRTMPLHLMLDLRDSSVVISGYMLHRIREVARQESPLYGRTAVLTATKSASQLVSITIQTLPCLQRRRLVFACEHEAVGWLVGGGRPFSL